MSPDERPQGPPTTAGPLQRREARLAYAMLAPTLLIVLAIVITPLLANFWISAKPVLLADLRPPAPTLSERVRGETVAAGETFDVIYTLRNPARTTTLTGVAFEDQIPETVALTVEAERCDLTAGLLRCDIGEMEPRSRERFTLQATALVDIANVEALLEDGAPALEGGGPNPLTSFEFTAENFVRVFDADEFWDVLWTSLVYTIGSTSGALLLGLFAALLLSESFRGRAFLRGLFLFPYVAPVIAVAYTWVTLLDPNSGAFNAILAQLGVIDGPVNFLGQRTAGTIDVFGFEIAFPMALTTVIIFEAWRYFPLAFLFILARMQSINTDMYEAAEIDGATPLQQFWSLSIPQLASILAVLFLLRFIWTFNKFDDIFLLTGGAAGTRTLTVSVYEQAIGLSNIGAGAAVAVVVFFVLLLCALIFFRFSPKEEA